MEKLRIGISVLIECLKTLMVRFVWGVEDASTSWGRDLEDENAASER